MLGDSCRLGYNPAMSLEQQLIKQYHGPIRENCTESEAITRRTATLGLLEKSLNNKSISRSLQNGIAQTPEVICSLALESYQHDVYDEVAKLTGTPTLDRHGFAQAVTDAIAQGRQIVIKPTDLALGIRVTFLQRVSDEVTKVQMLPYRLATDGEPLMDPWHDWLEDYSLTHDHSRVLATYQIQQPNLPAFLLTFATRRSMNPAVIAEEAVSDRITDSWGNPIEARIIQAYKYGQGPRSLTARQQAKVAGNKLLATQKGQARARMQKEDVEAGQFLTRSVGSYDYEYLLEIGDTIAARTFSVLAVSGIMESDDTIVMSADYCFTAAGPVLIENHTVLRPQNEELDRRIGISSSELSIVSSDANG